MIGPTQNPRIHQCVFNPCIICIVKVYIYICVPNIQFIILFTLPYKQFLPKANFIFFA